MKNNYNLIYILCYYVKMKTINSIYQTQIELKKSKFISFLVPIDEFKKLHSKLKEEHFKASHIVYAYRKLNEFEQIVENSSDDGEPKGAAGNPTLSQLRGEELINCAILTVRYFGGTKLGVGGMIRAYSSSAREVILSAKLTEYVKLFEERICIDYNQQRQVEYHFKELAITSINREFLSNKVCYNIKVSQDTIQKLKELNLL